MSAVVSDMSGILSWRSEGRNVQETAPVADEDLPVSSVVCFQGYINWAAQYRPPEWPGARTFSGKSQTATADSSRKWSIENYLTSTVSYDDIGETTIPLQAHRGPGSWRSQNF